MDKKVIVVGVVGLVVGFVGGATATWGLDPADEPVCPGEALAGGGVEWIGPALDGDGDGE